MSFRRRLASAVGSNIYGYLVNFGIQIGSVPILLWAWGPTLFGEWLMISCIPGYLLMSDLGLGTVLGNEMAMCTARHDRCSAISVFQTLITITVVTGLAGLLPFTVLFYLMPMDKIFGLTLIQKDQLAALIALFVFQVWLGQLLTVLQAGFRSDGYYACGSVLGHTLRLVEFVALAGAAMQGATPVTAAGWMVVVRIIGTAVIAIVLHVRVAWLPFGMAETRMDIIRATIKPAFLFLAFPAANAINLQTPLLAVGIILGPAAAATFSTTRTLTRAVYQLLGVVNASVWPEMSRAFGEGSSNRLIRLYRTAVKSSFWMGLFGVVAMVFAGPIVYTLWTHKVILFDKCLFNLLLLVVLANTFWHGASVVLAATNRHATMAKVYLLSNVALVPLCWILVIVGGLNGIALALLIGEIAIAVYVLPASLQFVRDVPRDFVRFTLNPFLFR